MHSLENAKKTVFIFLQVVFLSDKTKTELAPLLPGGGVKNLPESIF